MHARAGQPVDEQVDLVRRRAGQQLVAHHDGVPGLEGAPADPGPGALDVLAAQRPRLVLAAQLDRRAERLLARARRHPHAALGERVAVLLEGGGEHGDPGVREPDDQVHVLLGHVPRLTGPSYDAVNAVRTPGDTWAQ
ncbi:hypothetical protein G5V58_24125 [Nocardioides anomalus]|uniref:Uncharacterized protein n=1 Tax=Nocardioides anomalus TaxID=2712223 RepID=A0A6G6WJB8_9ACTN|nr:hypothetical protein [Nocardioides anomalus]QIG45428.1 hypothetical protein G5V58_24125 [Nocardioides anomalus]